MTARPSDEAYELEYDLHVEARNAVTFRAALDEVTEADREALRRIVQRAREIRQVAALMTTFWSRLGGETLGE